MRKAIFLLLTKSEHSDSHHAARNLERVKIMFLDIDESAASETASNKVGHEADSDDEEEKIWPNMTWR